MPRILAAVLLFPVLLAVTSAQAAPRLPKENPEWYSRQDTWQETVRVSREALVEYLDKAVDSPIAGVPKGVRFGPWHSIG